MIPYGRQSIDDADVAAVERVLRGDWLTTGPAVEDFERAVAEYTGARHAVAFNSATSALHGACHAAGLGPGNVVHTTPLTFMADANCARYVGARPALIDIDESTWNVDLDLVDDSVDALVAVHYAGLPIDLAALPHRPRVLIEDASHALGALTPDGPVGNCAHSDMTTFSFHPVKTVTTGEGGAVTTNDPVLAERLRRFRSHGIVHKPEQGGWYYEVESLGFNYRMTDLHAALGASQLTKLDRFVARRNALADRYDDLLAALPVRRAPRAPADVVHGRHLYPVRVPDRARVHAEMRAAGVGVQVHYVPVTHHPSFGIDDAGRRRFPETEAAYDDLLSLPLFPALTEADQDDVVDRLAAVLHTGGLA